MGLKSSKPCVDLADIVKRIAKKYEIDNVEDMDADMSMMKLINKFAFKRIVIDKEELESLIAGYKSFLANTKNMAFDSKQVYRAIDLYKEFCSG